VQTSAADTIKFLQLTISVTENNGKNSAKKIPTFRSPPDQHKNRMVCC